MKIHYIIIVLFLIRFSVAMRNMQWTFILRMSDNWPFVSGFHLWVPLTKGQQCGKCFNFMMPSWTMPHDYDNHMILRHYFCYRGFNDYWTSWICIYTVNIHEKFRCITNSCLALWSHDLRFGEQECYCMVFRQINHLDFVVAISPCWGLNLRVMLTC